MSVKENGVLKNSKMFLHTPSEMAKECLLYTEACGHYFTDRFYGIDRDFVSCYLLFFIIRGKLRVTSSHSTQIAAEGQVVFLDGHVPHKYQTVGTCEFIWFHIDGTPLESLHRQAMRQYGTAVFTLKSEKLLEKSMREFIWALQQEQHLSEMKQSQHLYGFLMQVLDHPSTDAESENGISVPVADAMEYVRKHYDKTISLEDIAGKANLSVYYFSRLFKSETGYSPHEYLMLTRMNRAKYLLKMTEEPVKSIAQSVGYQNASTFTLAFTNRIGMSPSEFRKQPL